MRTKLNDTKALIQNRKRIKFDVHAEKPGNYKNYKDVKIVLSTGKPALGVALHP